MIYLIGEEGNDILIVMLLHDGDLKLLFDAASVGCDLPAEVLIDAGVSATGGFKFRMGRVEGAKTDEDLRDAARQHRPDIDELRTRHKGFPMTSRCRTMAAIPGRPGMDDLVHRSPSDDVDQSAKADTITVNSRKEWSCAGHAVSVTEGHGTLFIRIRNSEPVAATPAVARSIAAMLNSAADAVDPPTGER